MSNDVIKELSPGLGQNRAAKAALMQDRAGGKLKKFFVLPDFHNIIRGYVKQDDEPISQQEQVNENSLM